MNVLIFGASGMVGRGVLRECLRDPAVSRVVSVGRQSAGTPDPKLEELTVSDVTALGPYATRLEGFDACFFCLGTTSVGKSEAAFRRVTYDLTIAVASQLAPRNPAMTFVYVSGAGTDSTERGPVMWARVKGASENALLRLPFRAAYMFRPGVIQPRHGIRSRTPLYRFAYIVMWPFLSLLVAVAPNSVTTTERVGRAMLAVARVGAPTPFLGTTEINHLGR